MGHRGSARKSRSQKQRLIDREKRKEMKERTHLELVGICEGLVELLVQDAVEAAGCLEIVSNGEDRQWLAELPCHCVH